MKKKIIELEEKLAHLEHAIDSLNKTIFHQNQQIDELQVMLKYLAGKVQLLGENQGSTNSDVNEVPPHY